MIQLNIFCIRKDKVRFNIIKGGVMHRILLIVVTISFMLVCPKSQANPLAGILGGQGLQAADGVAGDAAPIVVKGAGALLKGSFTIVKDALGVLWLPVGAVESTVGAPFGLFSHGLTNMADGVVAPFRVVGDVIKLPFQVAGAQ